MNLETDEQQLPSWADAWMSHRLRPDVFEPDWIAHYAVSVLRRLSVP